jgi:hypothetical protein
MKSLLQKYSEYLFKLGKAEILEEFRHIDVKKPSLYHR